jgi:hypothetical protein
VPAIAERLSLAAVFFAQVGFTNGYRNVYVMAPVAADSTQAGLLMSQLSKAIPNAGFLPYVKATVQDQFVENFFQHHTVEEVPPKNAGFNGDQNDKY